MKDVNQKRAEFTRILVPLDGSARSEQVLPLVARIASKSKGSVVLLRVINPLDELGLYTIRSASLIQEIRRWDSERAKEYLTHVVKSGELSGLDTKIKVYSGDAAKSILDVVQAQHIDLVVLCSHGYTGIKRWALGSVAHQVTRHSPVPVLVLREEHSLMADPQAEPHRIRACVALDGSPFAEETIEPAMHLVAALATPGHGEVHLLRVVVPASEEEAREYERHQVDIQQVIYNEACHYLQEVSSRITRGVGAESGIKMTWSAEVSRDVAEMIIQEVEGGNAVGSTYDLLAIATHGYNALLRWMVGSVTERVLTNTRWPLLIVRPPQQQEKQPRKPSSVVIY